MPRLDPPPPARQPLRRSPVRLTLSPAEEARVNLLCDERRMARAAVLTWLVGLALEGLAPAPIEEEAP